MKQQFLLLAASTLLILSCSTNTKPSHDDILIDSTVNAKVAAHDAANARKNDSIINAQAKIKADAMQVELDNTAKKIGTTKTTAATPAITPDSTHKK